jgi:hypothetical protein
MKILKHPDTKWSHQYTCTNCTAELEIEKEDLTMNTVIGDYRETGYQNWLAECPVCFTRITISNEDVPKAVQAELKRRSSDYR